MRLAVKRDCPTNFSLSPSPTDFDKLKFVGHFRLSPSPTDFDKLKFVGHVSLSPWPTCFDKLSLEDIESGAARFVFTDLRMPDTMGRGIEPDVSSVSRVPVNPLSMRLSSRWPLCSPLFKY